MSLGNILLSRQTKKWFKNQYKSGKITREEYEAATGLIKDFKLVVSKNNKS